MIVCAPVFSYVVRSDTPVDITLLTPSGVDCESILAVRVGPNASDAEGDKRV